MKLNQLQYCVLFLCFYFQISPGEAQSPYGINYQTIIRNGSGVPVMNQVVVIQISILKSTPAGEIIYQENHISQTNAFGNVNLVIGEGVDKIGDFSSIGWGSGDFYLQTALDPEGNGNYIIMGVSRFLSVPYALTTGSLTLTSPDGQYFEVKIDTLGNLFTEPVIDEWQCGDPFVDSRDDQVYGTVQVGDQCWMSENFNHGLMIDGIDEMADNDVIEKYCYNDDPQMCDQFGALYQWPEIMYYSLGSGKQGICPDGWHIPTDEEMKVLEGAADSQYAVGDPIWDNLGYRGFDAGGNLKESGTSNWNYPNLGATNSSGFGSLPHGYRKDDGSFANLGVASYFWSSVYTCCYPWYRKLSYTASSSNRNYITEFNGYGLRCLQD